MDASTHQYIAELVAERVPGLAPYREALIAASLLPAARRGSHHRLKAGIRRRAGLAGRARRALLRGKTDQAVRDLGALLHYIADGAVSVPDKDPRHEAYEAEVGELVPALVVSHLTGVGTQADLRTMAAAAPEAWLGEDEKSDARQAAHSAVETCVQIANAVFAPVEHPEDMARAERMQTWRRDNDEALARLLRFEHGAVWLPWANLFGVLLAFPLTVGMGLRRGRWFRTPWRFSLCDIGQIGFHACCVMWIWRLLHLEVAEGPAIYWQTLLASVVTFALWGFVVSTLWASRDLRGFWTSWFGLMGAFVPVTLAFMAFVMRFVEVERPGEANHAASRKAPPPRRRAAS